MCVYLNVYIHKHIHYYIQWWHWLNRNIEKEDMSTRLRQGLECVTEHHPGADLLCYEQSAYAFIPVCAMPFAVPGVSYSNCVCSIFSLSCWKMVSRKVNTIYPQNSAHDCSLNIWEWLKVLICGYPHLQMLSTLHDSLGLDELKHNLETRGWWAHENFSEIHGNYALWHSHQQQYKTEWT